MEEYRKSIASEDAAPHRRLAAVLQNVELGTPMYGVMRSNALRKTRLIGGFQGSDYVLFAELAMLGRIREVPEMLFKKRFHPARSTELYKHDMARAYIQWLNPRAKQRPKLFAQKLPFEYVRSIWRMPLSLTDRLLCTAWTLAVFYRRENEGRAERWKQRFMRVLRQRSSDGSRHQKQLELRENL